MSLLKKIAAFALKAAAEWIGAPSARKPATERERLREPKGRVQPKKDV